MNEIKQKKDMDADQEGERNNTEKITEDLDNAGGNGIWFILLFSIILILIIIPLFWFGRETNKVRLNYTYIALALVGVIFHLTSRFRKLREQGEFFKWKQYGFDYFFRAFQASVYVTVIGNLLGGKSNDPGNFSGNMVLISLFVGMYIRRVEEAFENMGDRFGDMLKGLLGTYVQRISPAEQRRRLEDLKKQFIDLKERYHEVKAKLSKEVSKELEDRLVKIKEQIQKGKIDTAEINLLDLDFRIRDLKVEVGKK
jgi:hypothetical protein